MNYRVYNAKGNMESTHNATKFSMTASDKRYNSVIYFIMYRRNKLPISEILMVNTLSNRVNTDTWLHACNDPSDQNSRIRSYLKMVGV